MTIKGKRLKKRAWVTLGLLLLTFAFSFKFASGNEIQVEPEVKPEIDEVIPGFELVNLIVKEGDTAWDIQTELTPNENVNDLIKELEIINNKSLEKINPGEILTFAKTN